MGEGTDRKRDIEEVNRSSKDDRGEFESRI